MKTRWSNRTFLLTAGMILVLLLFLLSAYLLIPNQNDIDLLNKQLKEEKQLTASNNKTLNQSTKDLAIKTTELQKKIPVEPLIENFILNLEQAQITSGSTVKSVSFQDNGSVAASTIETPADTLDNLKENLENAIDGTDSKKEAAPVRKIELPQGMKRVVVNLQVESPGFNELMNFLGELEGLDRIVSIDSVSFSGNREPRTTLDKGMPLSYTVSLSIFYYPELKDLVKDLPLIDAPQPSNKVNPLVPTGPVDNSGSSSATANESGSQVEEQTPPADPAADDSTSSENTVDEQNMDSKHPAEVLTHIVQPGETLFSIAMKYYHSPDGEETIKAYNNLKENVVYSGTSLKIPIYEN
ncbi:LysM peptidoglycan-binding domain-containing protein [Falsibacillus pallidus]|uniref:LysM peptidoglycan-binding domain-containing protein n=1 Tax=Falsibacillus pallidus TaxID=493781 RepID=UPI003D97224D